MFLLVWSCRQRASFADGVAVLSSFASPLSLSRSLSCRCASVVPVRGRPFFLIKILASSSLVYGGAPLYPRERPFLFGPSSRYGCLWLSSLPFPFPNSRRGRKQVAAIAASRADGANARARGSGSTCAKKPLPLPPFSFCRCGKGKGGVTEDGGLFHSHRLQASSL